MALLYFAMLGLWWSACRRSLHTRTNHALPVFRYTRIRVGLTQSPEPEPPSLLAQSANPVLLRSCVSPSTRLVCCSRGGRMLSHFRARVPPRWVVGQGLYKAARSLDMLLQQTPSRRC
ncbi:hypothetical protein BKA66DRAFT_449865 [Pyrenochaeta sp. MPI-SDFR-AT-0127]|nr:hypothetical protein BKA66DRAFT_449865 [Pyrenochaeta sp. MPI-SDFR-AT-0127]